MTIANFEGMAEDDPRDADWYRGAVDAARSSTASAQIGTLSDPVVANIATTRAASLDAAFLSRFIVLQAIGASFVTALWIAGVASRPFEGATAALCWIIVAVGSIGVLCALLQRWSDVQWVATHVVRIGLLGTVVGLIIAFSAARDSGGTDVNGVKAMITAVVDGMYVSLYATLLGIGINLWLKINLRLLGNTNG
jgi:MotA/TolQ/ExbB proton channel family protein